jgi:hypothetical protein
MASQGGAHWRTSLAAPAPVALVPPGVQAHSDTTGATGEMVAAALDREASPATRRRRRWGAGGGGSDAGKVMAGSGGGVGPDGGVMLRYVYGHDEIVAQFVAQMIPHVGAGFGNAVDRVIDDDGKLIAGVVYHNYAQGGRQNDRSGDEPVG